MSGGRLTLGIGAGGVSFDAMAMGQEAWSPKERADRFGEFLPLLAKLRLEGALIVARHVDLDRADATLRPFQGPAGAFWCSRRRAAVAQRFPRIAVEPV